MIPAKTGLELFEFCRRVVPFNAWSDEQLLFNIARAIKDNVIVYHLDDFGNISGALLGYIEGSAVHISGLNAPPGVMKKLWIPLFHRQFPGFTLKGYREKFKQEKTYLYG